MKFLALFLFIAMLVIAGCVGAPIEFQSDKRGTHLASISGLPVYGERCCPTIVISGDATEAEVSEYISKDNDTITTDPLSGGHEGILRRARVVLLPWTKRYSLEYGETLHLEINRVSSRKAIKVEIKLHDEVAEKYEVPQIAGSLGIDFSP